MPNDKLDYFLDTLQAIVALVGRIAYSPTELREIITKRKQSPGNYIKGYNACDGEKTVKKLSEIFEVNQGNLSRALSDWAELGIIYEISRTGG